MSTQYRRQDETVARRLRFLRGEQTQLAFSAKVGVSRSALANYETGRSVPNAFLISQIAEKAGVALSFFENSDLLPYESYAAIIGKVIEGTPQLTDDESAFIRALRVCDSAIVLDVIDTILTAITTKDLVATFGNLLHLEASVIRLTEIREGKGRFAKGSMPLDITMEQVLKRASARQD